MGLIYIVVVALLAFSIISAPVAAEASEDEKKDSDIITRDFSFRVGEGVRIGDYRVELTNVVSVMDGLVEVKVWKRASQFEDWRVMESRRDVNLDGGQDRGGLTLMVTEIFDRDTVRMRATYRSDYGYPEKYITERALAPASIPKLEVSTSADNSEFRSGDEVKVTIIVRNVGNDTARDVALQDMPPLPQFRYVAGYPPKIRNQLQPGESDTAIYSMVAVTEGEVTIPAMSARYADSKGTIYTESSSSVKIEIKPKRKPDIVMEVQPPAPIDHGGRGIINVSIRNEGDGSAYRVEVRGPLRSDGDGLRLEAGALDRSFFEIPPGGRESYSAAVIGARGGSYVIDLKASYQGDGEAMQKETAFEVAVLERKFEYLYYLPIVPVVIIGIWLYRRYREYKY